jgi:hypothetical protein
MLLQNGANAFALKEILGHSTMEMVHRYVHLALVDIDDLHRQVRCTSLRSHVHRTVVGIGNRRVLYWEN